MAFYGYNKCQCGNNKFTTAKTVTFTLEVTTLDDGSLIDDETRVESCFQPDEPYGKFKCTVCGAEYSTIFSDKKWPLWETGKYEYIGEIECKGKKITILKEGGGECGGLVAGRGDLCVMREYVVEMSDFLGEDENVQAFVSMIINSEMAKEKNE